MTHHIMTNQFNNSFQDQEWNATGKKLQLNAADAERFKLYLSQDVAV